MFYPINLAVVEMGSWIQIHNLKKSKMEMKLDLDTRLTCSS